MQNRLLKPFNEPIECIFSQELQSEYLKTENVTQELQAETAQALDKLKNIEEEVRV